MKLVTFSAYKVSNKKTIVINTKAIMIAGSILFLFSRCGSENHMHDKTEQTSNIISKYFPSTVDDSSIYVGSTTYTSSIDAFDTTYDDTIKIFRHTKDSLYFYKTYIFYKLLEPLPGDNAEIFTKNLFIDKFKINDANIYQTTVNESGLLDNISYVFKNEDSLYLTDNYKDEYNKNEMRIFKGKSIR